MRVPFVANAGQADPAVAFSASMLGGTVFVTRAGQIVYAFPGAKEKQANFSAATRERQLRPGWALTESFLDGSPRPRAGAQAAAKVSFFLGTDSKKWRTGLATHDSVELGDVWPGIEVSVRARVGSVEKFFVLLPGTPADRIRLSVDGAQDLKIGKSGTLSALTGLGEVTFSAPVAYQEKDEARAPVAVAYRVKGVEYGFSLGAHDLALPVVIDPLLQSTYLGGASGASVHDIAVHPASGELLVAGSTGNDFPGTAGGAQPAGSGAFVARLNSSLTRLIQATYVGGSGFQQADSLAIAPGSGEVLVAGMTNSTDFPGTGGGAQSVLAGEDDGFVARLSPTLTALLQATYFGGDQTENLIALTVHSASGEIFLAGTTSSTNLPGTAGGAQPAYAGGDADGFVARFNPTLTALLQATYVGGSALDATTAVAIHPSGSELFLTGISESTDFPQTSGGAQEIQRGRDSFVARFNTALTTLLQATYFGGSGIDDAQDLAILPTSGEILLAGITGSSDLPGTAGGAQPAIRSGLSDGFVAKLNPSLTALLQATYLGGTESDGGIDVSIFPGSGDILVAGFTSSRDFPGTAGGAQPGFGGPSGDAFAAKLDPGLTRLLQATYLGGSSTDTFRAAVIHPLTRDVYLGGYTSSFDFPGTAGGAQETRRAIFSDAFVARLSPDLSSADGQPGAIPALSFPALALLAMLLASAGVLLLKRIG
ncbi:MAG TPA: hypothetical protein VLE22_08730 [Bryobacteraceae bacterium]|nr:hypothetical protein [Bryobacteraceae bacterium]